MIPKKSFVAFAVVVPTLVSIAHAADRSWLDQAFGGDWNTAAKWSPATVPTAADRALFNGTFWPITINSSASADSLEIASTSFQLKGGTLATNAIHLNAANATITSSIQAIGQTLTISSPSGPGNIYSNLYLSGPVTATNLNLSGWGGLSLNVPNQITGTLSVTESTLNLSDGALQPSASLALNFATVELKFNPLAPVAAATSLTGYNSFYTSTTATSPYQLGALTMTDGATLNVGNPSGPAPLAFSSANFSGNVTIDGPVTLGSISGYGTVNATITAGAAPHTIAPSAGLSSTSTGNLTLASLTTNANTTLAFNLVTPGPSSVNDKLTITTALTITQGTKILLPNTPKGLASLGYYPIIQYTGPAPDIANLTLPATANNIAWSLDTTTNPNFISLHKGFLGDANDDGLVNFADFVALSNHYGQPNTTWSTGDLNNDHTTNFADFVILSNNYGLSITGNNFIASPDELAALQSFAATNPTPIPEPATLPLLATALAGLLTRRRPTRNDSKQ